MHLVTFQIDFQPFIIIVIFSIVKPTNLIIGVICPSSILRIEKKGNYETGRPFIFIYQSTYKLPLSRKKNLK